MSWSETPLPVGIRPTSLMQSPTGFLIVGDPAFERRGELERLVRGSFALVQAVAAALPTNAEDERLVDALVTKKLASLGRRPLRRRDPR